MSDPECDDMNPLSSGDVGYETMPSKNSSDDAEEDDNDTEQAILGATESSHRVRDLIIEYV